ncbi:DEAD/DEAH box helicase [Chitinimonas sp. BJB300]|uniref:DEAD/DEAH box helicase n=1 Tax=Chitinimonas sp. BJB300 TaxID=1559339 RepID=UPI000C0FFD80|nr:DEAD/DEAH box helicase [Chitinimonas sp. BJB300]PHV11453.1 RNA helicase [Chitinimonas sp. BJB300]TSJ87220.1 DEAD/DEAH box helicase [Chitinimonas sp. BJB300]
MSFDSLGLHAEILRAVLDSGYTEPTPVQARAIPVVLSGRDVMAGAQTGTGKTAAFTLPLLHKLQPYANTSASPARHPVRALILTPTRELCDQVFDSVVTYSKYLPLRAVAVFGGVDMKPQIETLRKGAEVVVATPGRLLDHVQNNTINLSQVEMLILDEADRMLDMGFILDIRKILSLLPTGRQTLLFSATFAPEIKRLAEDFMRTPEMIEVARRNATSELVEHHIHITEVGNKRRVLAHLIRHHEMHQVIVFTRTKLMADRLARELKREGFNCEAIHGDRTQQSRLETLAAFKEGTLRILVATDVAARGLDVSELPFVVNFEMPTNPEDYVHRIGRTGRAGATGIAISLVSPEEDKSLGLVRKLTNKPLVLSEVPGVMDYGRGRERSTSASGATHEYRESYEPKASREPRMHRDSGRRVIEQVETPLVEGRRRNNDAALGGRVIGNIHHFHRTREVTRELPALLLPPRYTVSK